MRKQIARCAHLGLVLAVVATAAPEPARAFCLWGFGQCESTSVIAGEYTRDGSPNNALTITSDTITAKTGPVSFSVHYTIKSVEGKNVTIEVTRASTKEIVQLQVEKDLIKVRNDHHLAGDWRKVVKP
jgi:hypothetical protein